MLYPFFTDTKWGPIQIKPPQLPNLALITDEFKRNNYAAVSQEETHL